jgi:hypothetical protein
VLEAGHADLTRRAPASRAGRRSRRALIQAILMAVGRWGSDSEESPPGRTPDQPESAAGSFGGLIHGDRRDRLIP